MLFLSQTGIASHWRSFYFIENVLPIFDWVCCGGFKLRGKDNCELYICSYCLFVVVSMYVYIKGVRGGGERAVGTNKTGDRLINK